MHAVHELLVTEIFLHPGDIDYTTVSQFLELGIIDVGMVHCRYHMAVVMVRGKQERVIGGR